MARSFEKKSMSEYIWLWRPSLLRYSLLSSSARLADIPAEIKRCFYSLMEYTPLTSGL